MLPSRLFQQGGSLRKRCFSFGFSSNFSIDHGGRKLGIISSETEEYSIELDVAIRIVQMACFRCQRVQESLISKDNNQFKSKDDNSPVTVAGNCIDCLQNGFFLVILYALLCATYFSSITVALNGTLAFILLFIIFFWRVFFQFFPLCYYLFFFLKEMVLLLNMKIC
uniref:Uncharacterized protein n=1 Tax=Nelumbo nucifera TaxID=4432 RepID=A0A822Z7U5_NELNU|nr:TPA_asm: hypothetical protein HUJ06_013858 [Nelumbo nucifera]